MAEWIVCPACGLKHSLRPTGLCPRCHSQVDGTEELPPAEAPVPAPLAVAAQPPQVPAAPAPSEALSQESALTPSGLPSVWPESSPVTAGTCVNHPAARWGLVTCAGCGRTFCPNCAVSLRGAFYCLDCKGERVRDLQSGTAEQRLTVMEVMRLSWQLIKDDFWPIWTLGLVFMAVGSAANLPGIVPYVGLLWQLGTAVFFQPAIQAGMMYVSLAKLDGRPAEVGGLFEGFRQRYWHSIVVMLPVFGLWIVVGGIVVVGVIIFSLVAPASDPDRLPESLQIVGFSLLGLAVLVAIVVAVLVGSMVQFAFAALWDSSLSGWEAFLEGGRVLKANIWPTLGLAFMLGLAGLVAVLAGLLALCVGLIFTMPIVTVWNPLAHAIAYRSWRPAGAESS